MFRGSYPGLFKHFSDLAGQYALANKPVFLTATGGGDHHALVLEHALRPCSPPGAVRSRGPLPATATARGTAGSPR
ncbi:NAD(P)H-dependent oxidoreductase [Streptomyces hoynatensis]|uniref:NAD(P)H-dependent oxidoreductase n=1 Tax=Streptomyces hoynatensis TaxID=1141874 RepID=UPI003BAC8AA4